MHVTRASTAAIVNTLDSIGAEPPPALAAALERHDKIRATMADQPPPGDVVTAVLDSLAAGKQPAADRNVQAIVAAQTVDNLGYAIEARMLEETSDAIRQDPDAIIEAMRPRFDDLAAELTEHHQALDGLALDDAKAVLHLAGDAAQRHTDARATLASLKIIETGWGSLALALGQGRDTRWPLAWCAAIDPKVDLDVDLTGKTPWSLLDQGIGLRLATPVEAARVGPAIRAAQDQRHDAAYNAAVRVSLGAVT